MIFLFSASWYQSLLPIPLANAAAPPSACTLQYLSSYLADTVCLWNQRIDVFYTPPKLIDGEANPRNPRPLPTSLAHCELAPDTRHQCVNY